MYLLDTNVISELIKRQPNSGVVEFFETAQKANEPLYLSVLAIGEISKGINKLIAYGDAQQADKLQRWLRQIKTEYTNHLLPVDSDASELWGVLLAITDDTNVIDKLIAATALLYDLTLVTRNTIHVAGTGVSCVNPFS